MIEPCSSNCIKNKTKQNRTRPLLIKSTFLESVKMIKINEGKFLHIAQHKGQRPPFASEVKRKEENLCLLLYANTGNNYEPEV